MDKYILIYEYQRSFAFTNIFGGLLLLLVGIFILASKKIIIKNDDVNKPLFIVFAENEKFQRYFKAFGVFFMIFSFLMLLSQIDLALDKLRYATEVVSLQGKVEQLHESDELGYVKIEVDSARFYLWKSRFIINKSLSINDSVKIEFLTDEEGTEFGNAINNEVYKIELLNQ